MELPRCVWRGHGRGLFLQQATTFRRAGAGAAETSVACSLKVALPSDALTMLFAQVSSDHCSDSQESLLSATISIFLDGRVVILYSYSSQWACKASDASLKDVLLQFIRNPMILFFHDKPTEMAFLGLLTSAFGETDARRVPKECSWAVFKARDSLPLSSGIACRR